MPTDPYARATCQHCGAPIEKKRRGRPRRFCDTPCSRGHKLGNEPFSLFVSPRK